MPFLFFLAARDFLTRFGDGTSTFNTDYDLEQFVSRTSDAELDELGKKLGKE